LDETAGPGAKLEDAGCYPVEEAQVVFERMLWFNPTDNQGARFNLADIAAGRTGG